MAANKLERLECLRGFAAVYVVAGHICNIYFHNQGIFCAPFRFAAEAVILFFLLSGFVIRYSTKDDSSFSEFMFKRFRRIYPLFFLSLWLSWGLISFSEGAAQPIEPGHLLGNVFMIQDFGFRRPGVWVSCFYNDALWSLSYEWWFYLIFFPLMKWRASAGAKNAVVWGLALASIAVHYVWPNQIAWFGMYFAVWWAGAQMAVEYRATRAVTLRAQWPHAVFLLGLSLAWIPPLLQVPRADRAFGLYPLIDIRRFASAGSFIIGGCLWRMISWRGFAYTFGPFKYLAPVSYGVYIFHFPVLVAITATPIAANKLLFVACALVSVVGVAYLGEILLQGLINRWTEPILDRIKARRAPAAGRG